ncbi:hypothetical protein GYMLUDRAFT_89204 [Collybiopsis luxurians FD-317 M1]|uniref:Aminotransferase class V domain-containing protein n=1 Tax=Collybiopsis luxurians FD-317 M1 TaxID=944289 RepID=A0A0D0BMT4_9AGAR|nr:hypothetical protein GYMLUDRAFT_89204 [Collybiopsis luxurians FD-317 M1]
MLIMAGTTYFIVAWTVHALCHLPHHPTIEEFPLTFPTSHSEILERFCQYLRSSKSCNGTTFALFDTIVSTPGIVMPWKEMVSICKAEGVRSLVDAAHSIGHKTNINLSEISLDFWVTSCSKWLYVKHGCSLLYVAPRNRSMIKHDLTPSMFIPDGKYSCFQSEFFWSGSMDAMTAMMVKPALKFCQSLGGEQQIVDYCHNLVVQGGCVLAKTLGTELMCSTGESPLELIGCMVNVALPSSKNATVTPQELFECESQLLEGKVYAQLFILNNCYWVRVSGQVFNQISCTDCVNPCLIILMTPDVLPLNTLKI